MALLKRLSLAFAAGALGAVVLYAVVRIGVAAGLMGSGGGRFTSLGFLYKQMVWGGIWGFAFLIPLLVGKWWARGLLVGLAASLVAMFVFMPSPPRDVRIIGTVLVLNMVFWGLAAAYWNDKVLKNA